MSAADGVIELGPISSDSTPEENIKLEAMMHNMITVQIVESIEHSKRYFDDVFEYRVVSLPREHPLLLLDTVDPLRTKLFTEPQWRMLGIRQSRGWHHYGYSPFEPHVLLFRRARASMLRLEHSTWEGSERQTDDTNFRCGYVNTRVAELKNLKERLRKAISEGRNFLHEDDESYCVVYRDDLLQSSDSPSLPDQRDIVPEECEIRPDDREIRTEQHEIRRCNLPMHSWESNTTQRLSSENSKNVLRSVCTEVDPVNSTSCGGYRCSSGRCGEDPREESQVKNMSITSTSGTPNGSLQAPVLAPTSPGVSSFLGYSHTRINDTVALEVDVPRARKADGACQYIPSGSFLTHGSDESMTSALVTPISTTSTSVLDAVSTCHRSTASNSNDHMLVSVEKPSGMGFNNGNSYISSTSTLHTPVQCDMTSSNEHKSGTHESFICHLSSGESFMQKDSHSHLRFECEDMLHFNHKIREISASLRDHKTYYSDTNHTRPNNSSYPSTFNNQLAVNSSLYRGFENPIEEEFGNVKHTEMSEASAVHRLTSRNNTELSSAGLCPRRCFKTSGGEISDAYQESITQTDKIEIESNGSYDMTRGRNCYRDQKLSYHGLSGCVCEEPGPLVGVTSLVQRNLTHENGTKCSESKTCDRNIPRFGEERTELLNIDHTTEVHKQMHDLDTFKPISMRSLGSELPLTDRSMVNAQLVTPSSQLHHNGPISEGSTLYYVPTGSALLTTSMDGSPEFRASPIDLRRQNPNDMLSASTSEYNDTRNWELPWPLSFLPPLKFRSCDIDPVTTIITIRAE